MKIVKDLPKADELIDGLKSAIKRRRVNFEFPLSIPRHWLAGSAFRSHLLNSFTLIFPEGEKYFIRSIERYSKQITNPKLKSDVREFMRQETQHYIEHEKFLKNLRLQGYQIDPLLKFIKFMTRDVLEPFLGPKMNLSITAGLEHFTALLAEIGLKEKFLEGAHPEMRRLFEWHAAEEIEHRAVAYDVLQTIDDSYLLRVAGLFNAYTYRVLWA